MAGTLNPSDHSGLEASRNTAQYIAFLMLCSTCNSTLCLEQIGCMQFCYGFNRHTHCSLTVEDMRLVCVQMPNMDLDVIEGSFRAREANDAIERSQHAPAVISPLDDWESCVCAAIHRFANGCCLKLHSVQFRSLRSLIILLSAETWLLGFRL